MTANPYSQKEGGSAQVSTPVEHSLIVQRCIVLRYLCTWH